MAAKRKAAEEKAAAAEFQRSLAAGAQKITEGQEPTHALHKNISNGIICFITCV